jgi:hypothetical protein
MYLNKTEKGIIHNVVHKIIPISDHLIKVSYIKPKNYIEDSHYVTDRQTWHNTFYYFNKDNYNYITSNAH